MRVLLYDDVVSEHRDLAAHAAGDSPCFEEWARRARPGAVRRALRRVLIEQEPAVRAAGVDLDPVDVTDGYARLDGVRGPAATATGTPSTGCDRGARRRPIRPSVLSVGPGTLT